MNELRAILAEWERHRGEPLALATVVRTEGSAYRRPGARMLIGGDGSTVGSVSGGCLESQVAEQGAAVRTGAGALLLTFDTTDPSDILFGTGTGCRGVVDLFIERIPPHGQVDAEAFGTGAERPFQVAESGAARGGLNPLSFAADCLRLRRRGVIATVVGAPEGGAPRLAEHVFLRETERGPHGEETVLFSDLVDPDCVETVAAAAREHLVVGGARLRSLATSSGLVEIFFDRIEPPPILIVFGAGYDAVPVVRLAAELGYEIALVDHRPAFATRERFPEASTIHVGWPAEVWDRLPLDSGTAVAILTHNYALDREILRRLLPLPVAYVGLLGPALRKEQILDELRAEGVALTPASLSRLHAPIGLDLGADTPETVALAILAEMVAARGGRTGGPLRERRGPIHSGAD